MLVVFFFSVGVCKSVYILHQTNREVLYVAAYKYLKTVNMPLELADSILERCYADSDNVIGYWLSTYYHLFNVYKPFISIMHSHMHFLPCTHVHSTCITFSITHSTIALRT